MSRFSKLSHVLRYCEYHIVWVPKYRYRVLRGPVGENVSNCIHVFAGHFGCVIIELNVQQDHVHLLVNIPLKVSISEFMGSVKGQTPIRVFKKFPCLVNAPVGAPFLGKRILCRYRWS